MTTATHARTRAIVEAYHQAWTGPDVASAGRYIAEDFVTRAPVGSYDTREEYWPAWPISATASLPAST